MIEAYAFLAAFAFQVLALSVLNPARFIRYVRGWDTRFASSRFAEMYPDFDYARWAERFATGFRAANFLIALLGLALLGWLFTLVERPAWSPVAIKATVLFLYLQMSPFMLILLYAVVRYRKALRLPTQGTKRKATLQRRGLFDFVSPSAVVVAVLSYVLFIPFAICVDLYVYGNTSLSKYCYGAIASVTFVYALNSIVIYKYLYGRKSPLVTHEGRVHTLGMTVKSSVYGSIAIVWFVVLMSFFTKLELENWRPFAVSVFMVFSVLLAFMGVTAPRKPDADELTRNEVAS
jgi:hypothetical protein